jgi:mono/diheme cytochrome c family protein
MAHDVFVDPSTALHPAPHERAMRFHILISPIVLTLFAACGGEAAHGGDTSAGAAAAATPATATGQASSSGTAAAAAPDSAASSTAGADGATIYQRCAACHQVGGTGVPGVYPPLAGSEIATGPAARPINIVLHGLSGPIPVAGKAFNSTMPPFGTGVPMSDAEIAAVLTYVRQSWGNAAPPVTPADVARERARG